MENKKEKKTCKLIAQTWRQTKRKKDSWRQEESRDKGEARWHRSERKMPIGKT
jgi:hypothetical protein